MQSVIWHLMLNEIRASVFEFASESTTVMGPVCAGTACMLSRALIFLFNALQI